MSAKFLSHDADNRGATSDRFDRLFWNRLWRLLRPYWASERRFQAFVLITAMTVLSLGVVGMQAIFSYVSRDVMNALQAKDAARFHHLLMLFVVWIVLFVPSRLLSVFNQVPQDRLARLDDGNVRAEHAAGQRSLPHHARSYSR
jgi:ABC-type uncharacterized transport system fused permease/ATPase subunit